MEYRKVGKWGLKISEVSLGSWLTFGNQLDLNSTKQVVRYAVENGINFIDTAEAYANGIAEAMLGMVLKEYRREDLVISTKIFWGGDGPNQKGLSRKHLLEGTWNSLKRLQLDYVDILYCHRPDPEVPMEEVVYTMDQILKSGLAFYWGTSEWSAEEIEQACKVAEKMNAMPPVVEQPQYNLIFKKRVEEEYAPIYEKYGIGTTIWSPLASGVLSGKYLEGIPEGSRLDRWPWLRKTMEERGIFQEETLQKLKRIKEIAEGLGVTMAQLSIAWCLRNPHVSSVILGVSSLDQLKENIKAVEVKNLITDEIYSELNSLF
ncbi:aldo/keto reductase [Fervidobacterium nodosum]|uniref:Aldo/keto reductase n=1 Tax=Fervidobacterium nodosum (strain ATCC 35602 / DSM 5306 / Rt17-B1) TaxID=381764 RepID=A7HL79_FERNB|nr:aldo/keto reductase [Fervidobacterium nodosum]ABS60662.1 aldo/keto reductase [Fervidobacterium nodosum Rt17-B1]PHJ13618.1 alcohol dehydrogenase [Fervidobacterium sp. SC_NGM5_G05]